MSNPLVSVTVPTFGTAGIAAGACAIFASGIISAIRVEFAADAPPTARVQLVDNELHAVLADVLLSSLSGARSVNLTLATLTPFFVSGRPLYAVVTGANESNSAAVVKVQTTGQD